MTASDYIAHCRRRAAEERCLAKTAKGSVAAHAHAALTDAFERRANATSVAEASPDEIVSMQVTLEPDRG